MTYKFKNQARFQKIKNSRRGPNNRYVRYWGHFRTAPVICWLIEKFNLKSFVEVGCCGAQLCETVLVEFPDVKVTAVDITLGVRSNRAGQLIIPPIEKMKREFGDRFAAIEAPSIKAAKLFDDNSLDLVYIDASHKYADVKDDIVAWAPKVTGRGILAGHDYRHGDNPGVAKAVDELIKNVNVADYYNWWVKKSEL